MLGALPQVSKPTADELAAGLALQMPLRGRNGQRLRVRIKRVTWWSYGDSNPRPLACHAHSARRHMWLYMALRGVHLRLPWLHVAWRRLVSLHVGSPPGSQNSLAPLMFEDLGGALIGLEWRLRASSIPAQRPGRHRPPGGLLVQGLATRSSRRTDAQ
jgi:hypothetical protein